MSSRRPPVAPCLQPSPRRGPTVAVRVRLRTTDQPASSRADDAIGPSRGVGVHRRKRTEVDPRPVEERPIEPARGHLEAEGSSPPHPALPGWPPARVLRPHAHQVPGTDEPTARWRFRGAIPGTQDRGPGGLWHQDRRLGPVHSLEESLELQRQHVVVDLTSQSRSRRRIGVPLHPMSQLVSPSCCGQRAACMLPHHDLRPAWSRHSRAGRAARRWETGRSANPAHRSSRPTLLRLLTALGGDRRSARVARQGVCQFLRHLPHNMLSAFDPAAAAPRAVQKEAAPLPLATGCRPGPPSWCATNSTISMEGK